jgi:hypothetical protein
VALPFFEALSPRLERLIGIVAPSGHQPPSLPYQAEKLRQKDYSTTFLHPV